MGLFMPDQAVETVIGQCRAFLEMGNGNYLYFDVCRLSDGIKYIDRERKKVTIYRKMHLQYPIMCFLRMSV